MYALDKNASIGVLDSGVGGLSVLKYLQAVLPKENFIFVGDTARTPYGTRTEAEIRLFVEEMLTWLERRGVKMIVIACNTLTMLGVPSLQKDHKCLLVGMSKGERLLDMASRKRKVGVFATPFTISTGIHKDAIKAIAPEMEVYPIACVKYVPLIEGEQFGTTAVKEAVKEYCAPLKTAGVDALILSCSHYPFIKAEIEAELGHDVKVIDPAQETAMLAKKMLQILRLENQSEKGSITVCGTADIKRVQRLASRMLEDCQPKYELINLKE